MIPFVGNQWSPDMKIYSILIGKVTSIADPEKLGRVKVELPLGSIHAVTDWAKVATFLVGNQFGSFFIPNVDDLVVVAFNDGNIDCPVVIGRLWNEKDKPPVSLQKDDQNHIELIKTKAGSEIRFENEKGKEKISLKTEKGEGIVLENSKKITISDSSGQDAITFDTASKSISIQGGMKIEIKSKGNKIVIDSTKNSVTIEAGVSMKLKAQSIAIEAGASMDIKSNGILNIKGAMTKIN
ncbi:MAG: phage baseplate assembly protein V [Clostridia bacterium]|nr:phage baseplate assembly protein V [Clostridia bacterium]